jgi:hypothetical protein
VLPVVRLHRREECGNLATVDIDRATPIDALCWSPNRVTR